jgi:cytochrome c-type biogenesis protein CcmH/NrfG
VKKGNLKGAVNAYKEALRIKPGDKTAKEALEIAERLLKEEETKKREAAYADWMKQGKTAMEAKKYADAIKAYDEALKIKPKDADATKGKEAAIAAGTKLSKQAEEDFKLAMDAGRAAAKKGNLAGAINAYKEALRIKPGDTTAKEALGAAERLQKSAEEAKKRDAAYAAWMKQGQTAMAAKKYADAVKAFDEALKIKPGDADAIKGKRAALDAQKVNPPPVNAKAEYDKCMQQGATLEKQRKYADAVKAFENALKQVVSDVKKNPMANTELFKAWMGIGRCQHAAKRYTDAVKAYEEALKRVPNQPDAKAALMRAKAGKP